MEFSAGEWEQLNNWISKKTLRKNSVFFHIFCLSQSLKRKYALLFVWRTHSTLQNFGYIFSSSKSALLSS